MNAEITIDGKTKVAPVAMRGLAFAVGFYFSFRLCIVLISIHLLGLEPSTGTALSLGLDLSLFALVCLDSIGAETQALHSMLPAPSMRWVMIFLVFSGLSLTWSETASLLVSIAYWMGLVLDIANVVLLLRSGSIEGNSYAIMKGFIWSTCCLGLIAWIMPTPTDLRLGDELYFNANEIGNACAFALFFAQYLTRSGDGRWRFAKWFLVITLIRSLSKTTLAAFVVSQASLLILDRSISRKTKALLLAAAFLLVLLFWGLFEAYYDFYTTTGNQAETLTGRTAIWLYVMSSIFDHPWTLWIGHGFDSWWKVVPPFGGDLFEARHAEDEVLQQLYAYGIAGVVILLGIYGSLFQQLRKLERSSARVVLFCFMIFIAVRGLAEADAFDLLLPLWSVVLLSTLSGAGLKPRKQIQPETVSPGQ